MNRTVWLIEASVWVAWVGSTEAFPSKQKGKGFRESRISSFAWRREAIGFGALSHEVKEDSLGRPILGRRIAFTSNPEIVGIRGENTAAFDIRLDELAMAQILNEYSTLR